MRRLLILVMTLGLLGASAAWSPTLHVAAAAKDSGSPGAGAQSPISGVTTTVPAPGAILATAQQYIGYPYAYIGDDPSTGFSCIGFAHYVFAQNGVFVPEELNKAYGSAPHVDEASLQPGDLVFFQNTVWDGISHVALYVGAGKMIAADSFQTGVEWDNLDDAYWQDHYLGATRPLSNPTGTTLDPAALALPSGPSLTPPGGPTLAVKAGTVLSPRGAATVYSGPGSSYAAIDSVAGDAALTAVQTQGQWVNVAYDGGDQYGWVRGDALNLPAGATGPGATGAPGTTGSSSSTPARPGSGTSGGRQAPAQSVKGFHAVRQGARVLVVTAAVLYVRAAPSRGARILRRVHAGDRLRLLDTRDGWDYVAQRDDARGWIDARWAR